MELTGDQYEQLEQALLDAYSTEESLSRMVRIVFSKRLNEIAEGANNTERIDRLIEWSESESTVVDLIRGAHRRKPSNEKIKEFCHQHCNSLLAAACIDNLTGLKADVIQSLISLPLLTLPMDGAFNAGLSVLPAGVSDDLSDKEFQDFKNCELLPIVRFCGFLKLVLGKFPGVKNKPNLLLFVREICCSVWVEPAIKEAFVQWVEQAEVDCGCVVRSRSTAQLPTAKSGTLEASLMISVRRYSKQQPDKPVQYQVNGYLYLDRIVGLPEPNLSPGPTMELSLPEAQEQLGIVCSWKQLPARTEQFLKVAIYQLTHQLKQSLGYKNHRLAIELFLPLEHMGKAVDQWPRGTRQEPLGKDYGVIVRFCDRLDDDERYNEISLAWEELAFILQASDAADVLDSRIESPESLGEYSSWRQLEAQLKDKLGLKLSCGLPETASEQQGLFEAMLYGDIPIAVWTRSAEILEVDPATGGSKPADMAGSLASLVSVECCQNPIALSEKLKQVRLVAGAAALPALQGKCLGDHVAFLLDNPDRSPLPPQLAS